MDYQLVTSNHATARRVAGLICVGMFVYLYHANPFNFGDDSVGDILWHTSFQCLSLIAGTFLCMAAAKHGTKSDKIAWQWLCFGLLLYLGGNSYVVIMGSLEIKTPFPNYPEAAYFIMAVVFSVALANYSGVHRKATRTTTLSFAMVYCAISVAALCLLQTEIATSSLSDVGNMVAFLYPALWLSVAAFGIVVMVTCDLGKRTMPFALLICAATAEASADLIYAKMLITDTYLRGGITEPLWMTSMGLIMFAAVEHIWIAKTEGPLAETDRETKGFNTLTLAMLPGLAILIALTATSMEVKFGEKDFYAVVTMLLGAVFSIIAWMRERSIIGDLRLVTDAALRDRKKLNNVLESISDSVIVVQPDWKLSYMNPSAEALLNRFYNASIGWDFRNAFYSSAAFPGQETIERAMLADAKAEFDGGFAGESVWINVRAFPQSDGLAIFFRDISESRMAQMEIEHLALKDTLTGLDNRASFHRSLNKSLLREEGTCVMLMDLDHFKEINDTKGHPVGDQVLRIVASKLQLSMNDEGSVARLGGDEFAIVMNTSDEESVMRVAARILDLVNHPMEIGGDLLTVGVSIGIALGRRKADADILLRNADIALYEVKNHGRGGIAFFEKAMETLLIERNGMKRDLAMALENNEFEMYYQPLVDLSTGRICSFEALLRWNHPEKGLMPPDTFIPLIEETGLIIPIGAWVMRTACKEATRWPDSISVAVNISTKQFFDPDLIETIQSSLTDTGLPAHRLELEITESALLNDSGDNLDTLAKIRGLGLKIALDDFGTGYSSLGYLRKFKFNKLKIDKSFIKELHVTTQGEAIVQTVINLGQTLGMTITAEGVETREQYDWLEGSCQQAQGHYISKPLPADKVREFIQDFKPFTTVYN